MTRLRPILVILAIVCSVRGLESQSVRSNDPFHTDGPLPGEREVLALQAAFPHRIEAVEIRGGEWALSMNGRWFYWAEGRLLPQEERRDARWREYVPIRFYGNYRIGVWREREITPQLEQLLIQRTRNRRNDSRLRFNHFLDNLYGIASRDDAERTVVRVEFLGMATRVHPLVVGPLRRVERRVRNAMLEDQETRAFVRSLDAVHGYNWRTISGTMRRSYHAYGMAVDLIPASWGGGWGYWQWAAAGGVSEWWELSFNQRWSVPQTVVDAFEAEGFVWGGKWLFFDNVHFEYRPEVLLLVAE